MEEGIVLIPTINANGAFGEVDMKQSEMTDRIRRVEVDAQGKEVGEEFFKLKFYTRYIGGHGKTERRVAVVAIYVSERFARMDPKSKVMLRPNEREAAIGVHVNNFSAWLFTYGHRRAVIEENKPLEEAKKVDEPN